MLIHLVVAPLLAGWATLSQAHPTAGQNGVEKRTLEVGTCVVVDLPTTTRPGHAMSLCRVVVPIPSM